MHDSLRSPPLPLWWLPLAAGALPLLATAIAFQLSVQRGLVPDCNPFVDGCTSISRAARHELPNILFRALLLPAAALQAACWMLCPGWARTLGAAGGRLVRALPALGLAAAGFLVLYGSFLGTEGEGYRWMRRYGVVFYFGLTAIGMLVVADVLHRALRATPGRRAIGRVLLALCAALPLLGLVHVLMPLALPGAMARDALQNVTEWWAGAIFTAFFFALAWAWRSSGFAATLQAAGSR